MMKFEELKDSEMYMVVGGESKMDFSVFHKLLGTVISWFEE